ncbi:hypothetical protein [Streptomyces sp. NBC_00470]|uniref:hypothetical protein n=1 Tax=Streptomyces sp. NBC_00470 TaxID=2975753 RepID=UPI0030DFAFEE
MGATEARIAGIKEVAGYQHPWPNKLPEGYDYGTATELDEREATPWDIKGWTPFNNKTWADGQGSDPITGDPSLVAAGLTRFYVTGDEVPDFHQEGSPGYPDWKH